MIKKTRKKELLCVQAFQPVAQIDNGESSKLIVECYISAQDRSRVNLGDYSKISLSGVNQTKYGLLNGTITSIGSGTVSQNINGENELLYQVTIHLEKDYLKSNNTIIKASASMPVTANIIYEKETYLDWILEQLNFTREK